MPTGATSRMSFESIAAAEAWGASLTGTSRPEEVAGLRVSTSLLSVLRVSPMLGRGFEPEDEQREAGRVVLLSHSLWQRRFGGDPSAVGRSVTLNGASYRVIGVMPAEFRFPPFWQTKAELWAPLVTPPQRAHDRAGRSLRVFARLKDGVSLERASAAMSAIASRIERAYPETNTDRGARVIPLQEVVVGPVRQALLVLLGAVAFLLLIACANVANLLLSRASGRQKEIAIRLALGAGRGRLVRQLLIESMALSLAGGVLGVVLSGVDRRGVCRRVSRTPAGSRCRGSRRPGSAAWSLLFSFAVSAATGILFGLAPALQFSRPDLHAALKQGGRGNSQHGRTRLRSVLVAGEIAVSLMLLGRRGPDDAQLRAAGRGGRRLRSAATSSPCG